MNYIAAINADYSTPYHEKDENRYIYFGTIGKLLPSFYGLDREDPYMHVKDFLEICSTFKFQNFSDESVKLRLFPFSLKDKSKAWLNSLSTGSITTWDQLYNKFLLKFCNDPLI